MSEAEMCTVQVATSDDQAPAVMTITMTPNDTAGNAVVPDNATVVSADDEGVIATSALQMVDCDDIMDGKVLRSKKGYNKDFARMTQNRNDRVCFLVVNLITC